MIATSGMDGSNPLAFVEKDIHWPNGLALDFSNDRLYWVDAKLRSISTVRLDGSDRKVTTFRKLLLAVSCFCWF